MYKEEKIDYMKIVAIKTKCLAQLNEAIYLFFSHYKLEMCAEYRIRQVQVVNYI